MLVGKQNELKSEFLFTVHQHGGDDVTWKPPITIFFARVAVKYAEYYWHRETPAARYSTSIWHQ